MTRKNKRRRRLKREQVAPEHSDRASRSGLPCVALGIFMIVCLTLQIMEPI